MMPIADHTVYDRLLALVRRKRTVVRDRQRGAKLRKPVAVGRKWREQLTHALHAVSRLQRVQRSQLFALFSTYHYQF